VSRQIDRGQLSLSAVEATIGVLLVLGVAMTFGIATGVADTRTPQLDAHAADVGTLLANERGDPDADGEGDGGAVPTIGAAIATPETFTEEREGLARRAETLVPDHLRYRVRTPHGSFGIAPPRGATVGRATVLTRHGTVRVEVWHG
jgi:hypothetical protein